VDSIILLYRVCVCIYNRFIHVVGSCCARSLLFEVINFKYKYLCRFNIFQQNLSRMDVMKVYFEGNSTEMDILAYTVQQLHLLKLMYIEIVYYYYYTKHSCRCRKIRT